LGVVILTSLGTWGLPQMVQKFYSIQSEKAVDKGTLISTLFAVVVSGGCYFLGGFSRMFSDRIDIANGFDSVIPAMLSGLSPLLIGVIIVLVLSASMSTLSSLVMASASTFTLDFLKGNIIKKMSDKSQLLTIRGLIVVFIAVSSVIAIWQFRAQTAFIAQLMGISWGALAGAFLAPFLYGLYWKRATKAAVWANFVCAVCFMTLNMIAKPAFPVLLQSPINAGAFVMLSGLVIVPLISAFTRAPEKLFVEETFAHYNDMVTVRATEALGEAVEERV
jgi:SSS family solute:Na+ symporter